MRQFYLFLALLLGDVLFFSAAQSQPLLPDSIFEKQVTVNLIDIYKKEIGQNLRLYNGREYVRNGQKAKGYPFFESDNPVLGSVYYDGKLYTGLELLYDLAYDEVIINNYSNSAEIALITEKLSYFSVLTHVFVRIIPAKENDPLMKPGYYERLLDGKISVFARREKKLEASLKAEDEAKYVQYNDYFLQMHDTFYRITGESSLLDLLKDKRDLLKKYIRANKINFRKNPEDAIVKTAGYYTLLNN